MPDPASTVAVIARSSVAPVNRESSLRSEQVTQLVYGETAAILESNGEWCRIRTDLDAYEGWVHTGYVLEVGRERADEWRKSALGWSDGARIRTPHGLVTLPLRARMVLAGNMVSLADGRRGEIVSGHALPIVESLASARALAPERWAEERFGGAPYQWGGVTPCGVDCSGLVQTTFAARGLCVPRDARQQALVGQAVDPSSPIPGDLLFFTDGSDRITHVAFAADGGMLLHSTLACGGFVREPWSPGTRAAMLRERLVAVRRFEARPA
ncbi:MAG: SH3 domain-containing C40 family peptidase [Gemmatimonadota bacterium]